MLRALPLLAATILVSAASAGEGSPGFTPERTAARTRCHELTDRLAYRRGLMSPEEVRETLDERGVICAKAYPEPPQIRKDEDWSATTLLIGGPIALLAAFAAAKAWDRRRARRLG